MASAPDAVNIPLYAPFLFLISDTFFSFAEPSLWLVSFDPEKLKDIHSRALAAGASSTLVPPYSSDLLGDNLAAGAVFFSEQYKWIWNIDGNYGPMHGCMLATNVTLPQEQLSADRAASGRYGLVYPSIIKERSVGTFSIGFLETNLSIVNSIFVPWTIAAAHYGRLSRAPNSPRNFKLDRVDVFSLRKNSSSGSAGTRIMQFTPRLCFSIYNVMPIRTDSLFLDYSVGSLKTLKVEFAHDGYNVSNKLPPS